MITESAQRPDLSRLRQRLRLETLYDLLVALHEHRTEQELLDELLQEYQSSDDLFSQDGLLKQLIKDLAERILQAELTSHLGYEKHASPIVAPATPATAPRARRSRVASVKWRSKFPEIVRARSSPSSCASASADLKVSTTR